MTWSRAPLSAAATAAAFPLGGIGTGNVSIGARGELRDWELGAMPGKGVDLPYTGFAIHVQPASGPSVTRWLEAERRPPVADDHGFAFRLAGLPRLRDTRMRGEYPILELAFVDDRLPVEVSLTAFTPFVPLDADASGIPVAILRYRVRNPASTPVAVTVVGSLCAPIGLIGRDPLHFPLFEGQPRWQERTDGGLRGLFATTDLPVDHRLAGTAALATADPSVTLKPEWARAFWPDGPQDFWDDLRADGRLDAVEQPVRDEGLPPVLERMRVGSLGIAHDIPAGGSSDFEFLLGWHVPNRPRAWLGNIGLDATHRDEVVRQHYATRYTDAWDVVASTSRDLPVLEAATRAFREALYGSSLPAEVVDAAGATLATLRSTTCFRLEDGTFAAFEGSFDRSGSCEGTCTHVWNYAQTAAFVMPALERSARRTEFRHEVRDDGRMNFRTNAVFGNEAWDFHPAIDGQLGAIVRLYREWRFSGDDAFLADCWPGARRALEYVVATWDPDESGVPEGRHHNTYDIEFEGAEPMAASVYLAALRASAEMAAHEGDEPAADRYRDLAERGCRAADARLFNGEYYEQRLGGDINDSRYQYGTGVLADQLLGQTLAHVAGLGHVLPAAHVRSAIEAVFRHDFRPDLREHHSVQRAFALGSEAGLVLCSWPRGGRPRFPMVYSDEVWTGVEYQVATTLVHEGLIEEALTVVRAARDRHDGIRRSPWNETECGNHYARSLASWGVLLALSGIDWDGRSRRLRVAPRLPGPFRAPFTTGTGWGRIAIDGDGLRLTVHGGRLDLDRLEVVAAGRAHDLAPPPLAAGETYYDDLRR